MADLDWAAATALAAEHDELEHQADSSNSGRRPGGRPKGGFSATIDWDLGERLYVQGEIQAPKKEGDAPVLKEFSMLELSKRLGCSNAAVGLHAKRHDWGQKRADFKGQPFEARVRAMVKGDAKARARSTQTPLTILDAYIALFGDAVAQGKVRVDDIGAFDKAARLRAFLMGEAESRTETKQVVTLEAIQGRHAEVRKLMTEGDARASGVVEEGEVIDE